MKREGKERGKKRQIRKKGVIKQAPARAPQHPLSLSFSHFLSLHEYPSRLLSPYLYLTFYLFPSLPPAPWPQTGGVQRHSGRQTQSECSPVKLAQVARGWVLSAWAAVRVTLPQVSCSLPPLLGDTASLIDSDTRRS